MQNHAVMGVNRAWAILHPISYRTHQTKRFSCCVCGGIWAYSILVFAVGPILDALYYRVDITKEGCTFNLHEFLKLPWLVVWSQIKDVFFDLGAIGVVQVSFIVVSIKLYGQYRERREGSASVRPSANRGEGAVTGSRDDTPQQVDGRNDREAIHLALPRGDEAGGTDQAGHTDKDTDGRRPSASAGGEVRAMLRPSVPAAAIVVIARSRRNVTRKYILLGILTLSVLVFYCPAITFYVLYDFVWGLNFAAFPRALDLYQAGWMLWPCQQLMDPLIFSLTLDPLRQAMLRSIYKLLPPVAKPRSVQPLI